MSRVSIDINYLYDLYLDEYNGEPTYTKKGFVHLIEEKIEDLIREKEL